MSTFITNARIFDGEHVRSERTVEIRAGEIVSLGRAPSGDAEIVDGNGGTLLPGLIDGHVHTSLDGLRLARVFGVTTELEMQGYWTPLQRKEIDADDDLADVRSALLGLMADGGHPRQFIDDLDEHPAGAGWAPPSVSTPDEAVAHVRAMVAQGADYIKVMIEEGTVLGHPGLPLIDVDSLRAGVAEAHRLGKQVIAHAMTLAATWQAVEVGVDGLAHLFIDLPHTDEIVSALVAADIFVTPCLVVSNSVMGGSGRELADDPRVSSRLPEPWLAALRGSFDKYRAGDLDVVLASVAALHEAGVDIIAGTDASIPLPSHGGVAHGASIHHELQLLVAAGLTPIDALRAATSVPAKRFGLDDRGRIAPGARADLVLVDGDPTTRIDDSLSLRAVWRRGTPHFEK
ncbi:MULTISPECIES: amidohydrolase family protein [unclassified Nocardia]|uniref:amidohydrolase family protein n=1 Tax=unclassified Nocardia TaxID=2637762 RepID=UPI001CE4B30D|nr:MULTISPECIES: amidohydrolase family protein [unclassified Nocardia]